LLFDLGDFMKKIAATLIALAALGGTAQAADLVLETPDIDYAGAFDDWSGFYAGVVGGLAGGTGTSTSTLTGTATNIAIGGGLLGIAVGYNHQIDNFVLGGEAELLWSSIGGSAVCNNPAFNCSGSLGWLGSVRGRAGVVYDAALFYGTAGVAVSGFSATTTPAPGVATGTFNGTGLGWTAGAGVEFAVSDSASIKAEYAYYNLGARAPANTVDTPAIDLRAQIHAAKLGVNFKF
jgi:outer membrane immunogenic protein